MGIHYRMAKRQALFEGAAAIIARKYAYMRVIAGLGWSGFTGMILWRILEHGTK